MLRRTQNAAVPAGLGSCGAGEMQLLSSSLAPPASAPNDPLITLYPQVPLILVDCSMSGQVSSVSEACVSLVLVALP